MGNSQKRGARGGNIERDRSQGLAWRLDVCKCMGLFVYEQIAYSAAVYTRSVTPVTSAVFFLASRLDTKMIRNVDTHWSVYFHELFVSFTRSLSSSPLFINIESMPKSIVGTIDFAIILVMNDTLKVWNDLASDSELTEKSEFVTVILTLRSECFHYISQKNE